MKNNCRSQRSGLSSPANQSLMHSLYVAALDRHLGIRGLISPVTDNVSGFEYDFFHPASGRLIKIFNSLDDHIIEKYCGAIPEPHPIFIVDNDTILGDDKWNSAIDKFLGDAVIRLHALQYLNDMLLEHFVDEDEEDDWEIITPIERARCIDAINDLSDE